MKILLVSSAYNGLTQHAHLELQSLGHEVSVELALSEKVICEAVEIFNPDLLICPFLKRGIPRSVWERKVCLIVHPGIKGDRGPSSLDWAIMNSEIEWGVTVLQAIEEMDAGPVWANESFLVPENIRKSDLYNGVVKRAALKAIKRAIGCFELYQRGEFLPEQVDFADSGLRGKLRPLMKQKDRKIYWNEDSTETVLRKIRAADGQPGVLDEFCSVRCYLYGACEEDSLKGAPHEILAKRDGAICVGTVDGAVWISHLRQLGSKKLSVKYFKLPAETLLGDRLKGVERVTLSLDVPIHRKTYREISCEKQGNVALLSFCFYNGAMGVDHLKRLTEAYRYVASKKDTRAIVLASGLEVWGNGIHLNLVEHAKNSPEYAWENINAMNDFIKEVMSTKTHLTISAIAGNAGAGGIMMALGSDFVYSRPGLLFNPHYKTMGLFGSEYWTYNLPKKIGDHMAGQLTENCLPITSEKAVEIGLIDGLCDGKVEEFVDQVAQIANGMCIDSFFRGCIDKKNKNHRFGSSIKSAEICREEELQKMYRNFFENDRLFSEKRRGFVYKLEPVETPFRIAIHRKKTVSF